MEQGVTNLNLLRLNGLDKITDDPTARFCIRNKKLAFIEIAKCIKLTIAGVEHIIKGLNCLKRLNINMIPAIKLETIKETIESKPSLQILQFAMKAVDPRDNGLRVPLPKKKKKKKAKKSKKGKK